MGALKSTNFSYKHHQFLGRILLSQKERKPAWLEGLMEKIEDMHIDVKAEIKTTNQRCEKFFEKHKRRIDLHDTVLTNIEVQIG